MARSKVPQFGDWENQDAVPYTVCFEKARKDRGGKIINPNDPQQNPDMFPDSPPLVPSKSKSRPQDEPIQKRGAVIRPTSDQRASRELDADFRPFMNSPSQTQSEKNTGRKMENGSINGGGRGNYNRPARSARPSVGSEQSFERSPLHQKVVGRGKESPAWDGKSYDSSHGTSVKSRLRPAIRGHESPDKGTFVPKFGDWDENNPDSAENFTQRFNKVREERNYVPAGNVNGTPKHPYNGSRNLLSNEPKKPKSCLPWWLGGRTRKVRISLD